MQSNHDYRLFHNEMDYHKNPQLQITLLLLKKVIMITDYDYPKSEYTNIIWGKNEFVLCCNTYPHFIYKKTFVHLFYQLVVK